MAGLSLFLDLSLVSFGEFFHFSSGPSRKVSKVSFPDGSFLLTVCFFLPLICCCERDEERRRNDEDFVLFMKEGTNELDEITEEFANLFIMSEGEEPESRVFNIFYKHF